MDRVEYILEKLPGHSFNNMGKLHCRCPFHSDNSPSFSITEDGLFICGSPACGVKGNFFQFYKLSEGITSWSEVNKRLRGFDRKISTDIESMLGVKKREKKPLRLNTFPIEPFVQPVQNGPYLRDRGLSLELMEYFGVLYGDGGIFDNVDITNSLVIPVYDHDGSYMTFQVRRLANTKKRWQHPGGSAASFLLYGGWLIYDRTPYLWVVEGPSDVWQIVSYGDQAVGIFTNKATDRQINLIVLLCKRYKLTPVVMMDGDAKEATRKIYMELLACNLPAKASYLEDKEDPGSLMFDRFSNLKEQVKNGGETSLYSRQSF